MVGVGEEVAVVVVVRSSNPLGAAPAKPPPATERSAF